MFDPFVFLSNSVEQWLIARQRIGKQNNDASNENWKGREYNGIIKNIKSYSKFLKNFALVCKSLIREVENPKINVIVFCTKYVS